tara:strand:+ start:1547 stop:1957 length:411 start_codon:yes stop_codon:yes gene_type:complete
MIRTLSPILAGLCFLMFSLSSVPNMGGLYDTNETKSQDETKPQDEEPKVELLYFGATWCPPCRIMKPLFKDKEVKKELGKYNFVMYDYDQNKNIAKKYKIKYLPTMIFKKSNSIIERKTGGLSKTKLLEILKKNSR